MTYKRVSKGENDSVIEALYEKGYDNDGWYKPASCTLSPVKETGFLIVDGISRRAVPLNP